MKKKDEKHQVSDLMKILGYEFKNEKYLFQALTHTSYVAEVIHRNTDGQDHKNFNSLDNERLEFLGDRVLGLSIANLLCERYPNDSEGQLARRYNALVNHDVCAKIAWELGVQKYMYLGPSVENRCHKTLNNILADAMEAIIAAIYKDSDFQSAKLFVENQWKMSLDVLSEETPIDHKSQLQEWYQKKRMALPMYEVAHCSGPAHKPTFKVVLQVEDEKEVFVAMGKSKREAQQNVANKLLIHKGLISQ